MGTYKTNKGALIDKLLKVDPESKIPFVFHRVYQHVLIAIYSLASLMGTAYPLPDLLFSGRQGIPVEGLEKSGQSGSVVPAAEAKPTAK